MSQKEIQLEGSINENLDLSNYTNIQEDEVVFDLSKVRYVSSSGLGIFIDFLRSLSENTKVIYRNCPQSLVKAFGSINGLIKPDYIVESIKIPVVCESCDHQDFAVLQDGKDYSIKEKKMPPPDAMVCPECGNKTLHYDIHTETYFKFMDKY